MEMELEARTGHPVGPPRAALSSPSVDSELSLPLASWMSFGKFLVSLSHGFLS